MNAALLTIWDFLIFGFVLVFALAIGIYHSIRKKQTAEEFFLGSRTIGLFPMILSTTATYVSTITVLGYPAEIFGYGAQLWLAAFAQACGAILASFVFVTVFYPLKLTSINEYLYLRYESLSVMRLGSLVNVFGSVFLMGSLIYGPCTAVEIVMGLDSWIPIVASGGIAILYTALGGFRTVVWVDVMQFTIMIGGMLAVVIQGCIYLGGTEVVWKNNSKWDRLNFFDFDPDPTKRMNFYGVVFGNMLTWASMFGIMQAGFQRYSSMKTLSQARWCIIGIIPGASILISLACFTGLVIFAHYAEVGCDPIVSGGISNYNQILPYYISEVFKVPGLPGIFLACVVASSLSSMSSELSGSSANVWIDLVSGSIRNKTDQMTEVLTRLIVVFLGCIAIGMAFLITNLKGTILQVVSTFTASVYGPLGSLYINGIFFPWVNSVCASIGTVCGVAFGLFISIGGKLNNAHYETLPSPNDCINATQSMIFSNLTAGLNLTHSVIFTNAAVESEWYSKLFQISWMWQREVNTLVSIIVANIISIFYKILARQSFTNEVDARFVHPITAKVFKMKYYQTNEVYESYIKARHGQTDLLSEHSNLPANNSTVNSQQKAIIDEMNRRNVTRF